MKKKKIYIYTGIVVTGLIIAMPTYAINGQGNGQGVGNGSEVGNRNNQKGIENMVDENNNGIPDGQEDFDDDGIINRDDNDYERQYINMRDADDDGVANRDDDDYTIAEQNGDNTEEDIINRNQNRIANRYNNEVLGNQVRVIAREQEEIQNGIADDIATLQRQNSFRRFLVGADQNNIENAKIRLEQHKEHIVQLKELSKSTTDVEDKAIIDAQVKIMESVTIRLREQINENSGGFSLFGWMLKLFK